MNSLLPQVALGDNSAIAECIDRYGGLIWSLANRLVRNRSDVEDAVHDVFIEIWQAAKNFDSTKGSEITFVAMLARRRLVDRWRLSAKQANFISGTSDVDVAAPESLDVSELNDEARKAFGCFQKLTNHAQAVLRLSIHDDLSYSQISSKLEMPLGSVKSYARRGLLQLRDCMSRPMGSLADEVTL